MPLQLDSPVTIAFILVEGLLAGFGLNANDGVPEQVLGIVVVDTVVGIVVTVVVVDGMVVVGTVVDSVVVDDVVGIVR